MFVSLSACGSKENAEPEEETETTAVETEAEATVSEETEAETAEAEGTRVVVDVLGREVEIPAKPEKFVNVGVGTLRLYTYVAPIEKLVGVEQTEVEEQRGVPYTLVNAEKVKDLPIIGAGGPRDTADPEAILATSPDVIFDTYSTEVEAADELQEKTGIPVVVLSYGKVELVDEDLHQSIRLIGDVTGEQERAEEVINIINNYLDDISQRVSDIDPASSPTIYIGAMGNRGQQGIESTRGNNIMTNILKANNVSDEVGEKGGFFIDKEQLLEWDPEYIFVDADGLPLVREDYQNSPALYDALTAVQEGKVYSQLPFKLRHTNLETAIADIYNIGKVIYPDEFSDVELDAKADEIYESFLGAPLYDRMIEDFAPFGTVDITQE